MSQSVLDLKLTVKAETTLLNEIYDKVTCGSADSEAIAEALTSVVEQAIKEAGVSGNFAVEFHCGQVQKTYLAGGGLNAREWMETDTPAQDLKSPKGIDERL
ncbi:MAG TPA: hypothetical protein PKE64_06165 [Anaerolineae bacterium]|nr:hypothetical protein [Anaerolineae bacterium]HMR63583.1 hypothetical protein [Anaerolineae bacterium]